jgi:hypothetical protein
VDGLGSREKAAVVGYYERAEELSVLLQSILAKITMPAGSLVSTKRHLGFHPAGVIDLCVDAWSKMCRRPDSDVRKRSPLRAN